MIRNISAYKGGRSVRKSSDVTPEVARMLAYLKRVHKISLGDLIDRAVKALYAKKHPKKQNKQF